MAKVTGKLSKNEIKVCMVFIKENYENIDCAINNSAEFLGRNPVSLKNTYHRETSELNQIVKSEGLYIHEKRYFEKQ